MQTFEHRAIQAELDAIIDPADLRDALYHFGKKFHVIKIAGYPLRFERRKARASDWRIGLGAVGMAGLMSLAFVLDKSLVPAFINSAPYIGILTVLGMFAAAARRIRVSDWFVVTYLGSCFLAALMFLPVILLERDVPALLAAGFLFSISLALFMNISTFFYVLNAHFATWSFGPAWHEAGA